MTTFYIIVLALGVIGFGLRLWSGSVAGGGLTGEGEDDISLPGTRVGRTDDYSVEGGVGGAEGEGPAPGTHAVGHGGIGGAEGGDDASPLAPRSGPGERVLPPALVAFGAVGITLSLLLPDTSRVLIAVVAAAAAVGAALLGLAGGRGRA